MSAAECDENLVPAAVRMDSAFSADNRRFSLQREGKTYGFEIHLKKSAHRALRRNSERGSDAGKARFCICEAVMHAARQMIGGAGYTETEIQMC